MFQINENYPKLPGSYLFSEIGRRVNAFQKEHPEQEIIRLGIGDVTRPLMPSVVRSMHAAVDEMSRAETFRGYAPEQGYEFLRTRIARHDFASRGCDISPDEIFVSDGAKCDVSNIQEIFSTDCRIAVGDPVYPVYVDANVMAGRAGEYDPDTLRWSRVIYLPCTEENGFVPELPEETPDLIYLCSPNNPTGTAMNRQELQKWVDYANREHAVILFDAAYEAYIHENNIPHSIFECPGAKTCAIEIRSFSKTAGFTGVRLGYTVVPRELVTAGGQALHPLWIRRQSTRFNGVSYIQQQAGAAVYTEEGQREVEESIAYYMENAKRIREGLQAAGFTASGGVNAPYIWLKTPGGLSSWQFFDQLLEQYGLVGTPGAGFGACGEGYFRLTAFGSHENTDRAMERLRRGTFG